MCDAALVGLSAAFPCLERSARYNRRHKFTPDGTSGPLPGLASIRHLARQEHPCLMNAPAFTLAFSKHFEASNVPARLPHFLPDDWKDGLVLLVMMMWIDGVHPLQVLEAYVAAGTAMLAFGVPAALQQQRYSAR